MIRFEKIINMGNKALKGNKKEQESHSSDHKGEYFMKLLRPVDKEKKVVAVIVSFVNQESYDHLFESKEQEAEEGTQVLVYSADSYKIEEIMKGFQGTSTDPMVKEMIEYIGQVDSDCVVFNWECSSGYTDEGFPEGEKPLFNLVGELIKRGFMLMFSDFSLKSLIKKWDEKVLGPNPFRRISTHDGNFKLDFDCGKLRDCPSAQLQIIGEMASQGFCNVGSMPDTIIYGVEQKEKNEFYDLEVLTVASSIKIDKKYSCQIGDKKGAAGHVLLKYKNGGYILTSMGHWIELMKINTTEETLFKVAEREYGATKAQQMRMEYDCLEENQKMNYISSNAVEFVQKQAPSNNMARKMRSKY